MTDLLLVERRGAAALLTLNRPEKRNALSLDLRAAAARELESLAADEDLTCLVITGAGSAFCAGMDMSEFGGDREHKQRIVDLSLGLFQALGAFPKPLIAAINGPAIAGGFALALMCDMRLASETATMGFSEVARGIPPGYAAARAALPAAVAADLCLTGRLVDAREALELGVVSRVLPADELMSQALDLAAGITSVGAETRRRILIERETWQPLFDAEEQALRQALLG